LNTKVPKPLNKQYDTSPTTFGAKLRNKRLELSMSIRDFSKLLGVSETTVFLWESNKVKPRMNNYPKIIEIAELLY
jgi:DNA-binding transcriptional regulator YiaG